jgi:hypothetical protein
LTVLARDLARPVHGDHLNEQGTAKGEARLELITRLRGLRDEVAEWL